MCLYIERQVDNLDKVMKQNLDIEMATDDKKAKLLFIPMPVMSHMIAAMKTAVLLSDRHPDLSIVVLVLDLGVDTEITSFTSNSSNPRVTFVQLPRHDPAPTGTPRNFIFSSIPSQKDAVRATVRTLASESEKLAGFVLDMFCTSIIDVADEFNLPSYVLFTSGSAALGLLFHLQSLRDDRRIDLNECLDSDTAIAAPSFVNPVPARVWPQRIFENDYEFLNFPKDFTRTKGIIVNSFPEFETHAINSLSADVNLPPIFPVGPILHSVVDGSGAEENRDEILTWLDQQPYSSVVFLCFGSAGSFDQNQVMEIARALENIEEIRFLWSLRKPPVEGTIGLPAEYENPGEVLPEGFLDRTAGIGRVIGWAPQMAVLSHPAVGGFVSHGGWNSTLESVWCGVPMAVWPLYAEQQLNTFELVVELGMAVEVKMGNRSGSGEVVAAETVEEAVRRVMDRNSAIRGKVKAFSGKSIRAGKDGGSSFEYLGAFIETVFKNIYLGK